MLDVHLVRGYFDDDLHINSPLLTHYIAYSTDKFIDNDETEIKIQRDDIDKYIM